MNINTCVGWLTDELSDYVGLKSGLAITAADAVRLLDRELARSDESKWWYSPREWLSESIDCGVRIRAENMESLVMRLLCSIGALPTPWNQMQLLQVFAHEHPEIIAAIPPDPDEDESLFPVTPFVRFRWFVEAQIRGEVMRSDLADFVEDYRRRSILELMNRTAQASWDGVTPLKELFDLQALGGEAKGSKDSAPLIDQRFVDYLHSQPEDLSQIHWRQFEFLCGEFFRRNGYNVIITPPSRDGGIDVRAVRETAVLGPELVLIQAKRFADGRPVGIESVKALWSDVDDANATRGVIATTSTLASGAQTFCQARHYRLTAAERPTVENWLKSMATHPRWLHDLDGENGGSQ